MATLTHKDNKNKVGRGCLRMFEISLAAILAVIFLFLYPSLRITVLYVTGFCILALIGGGVVFYLATTANIPAHNAVWLAMPVSLFSGVGGMIRLTHAFRQQRGITRFLVR